MISKEDQIMMETLYWWGIPTLFRCKNDPDPNNCDIALVGVPHSTGNGTTERDQHLGPICSFKKNLANIVIKKVVTKNKAVAVPNGNTVKET